MKQAESRDGAHAHHPAGAGCRPDNAELLQAQLSGDTPLSEDALQKLLSSFDGAVREGIGISREDQRHWQQVWFEAHKSSQWRALIY